MLDVMGGRVVRAVGGRRSEYRPVQSRLTASTESVEVARVLLATTGSAELYVADLDAIEGRFVSDAVLELLDAVPVPTWLDAGIRETLDIELLPSGGHIRPVIASETAEDLGLVHWVEAVYGYAHAAFSLDLSDGSIRGRWQDWGVQSPRDWGGLATNVAGRGARTLVVLDLAGVGTQDGPRTTAVCRAIRKSLPRVELITGGGVRDRDDLRRLEDAGADAVLVASALHDGALP